MTFVAVSSFRTVLETVLGLKDLKCFPKYESGPKSVVGPNANLKKILN